MVEVKPQNEEIRIHSIIAMSKHFIDAPKSSGKCKSKNKNYNKIYELILGKPIEN